MCAKPLIGPAWNRPCPVFRWACDSLHEGETQRKPAIHITENWFEEFRDREQDSMHTSQLPLVRT